MGGRSRDGRRHTCGSRRCGAYLGLLCQGKSDFDQIEAFRQDHFFGMTLGLREVPFSPTLRQRLDLAAEGADRPAPRGGWPVDEGGPLYLSGSQVLAKLPVAAVRQAVEGAFDQLRAAMLVAPVRQTVSDPEGSTLLMPARSAHRLGLKVLRVRPDNAALGFPTILGEMLVSDRISGRLLAVIDAPVLTALRTGGLTALASRRLAPAGTQAAALIGAGFQAAFQARALVEACPQLRTLRLCSRTLGHSQRLASALRSDLPEIEIAVCATVGEAVRGAQVVTTATASTQPLLGRAMLGAEVHINAIGAYTPQMAELAPDLLAVADQIYVDTVAGCRAEAGDLIQAVAQGAICWGAVRSLGALKGRRQGITIFKSVGSAAFDLAVAEVLLGAV